MRADFFGDRSSLELGVDPRLDHASESVEQWCFVRLEGADIAKESIGGKKCVTHRYKRGLRGNLWLHLGGL
jgi:hypothetical protein